MTREDAIDIIKSECYVFNPLNFDRSTMVNTALDMAVKALEFDLDKHDEEVIKNTVETLWGEPCEDCISRKWLKNAIHNFYKGLIHTPTEEDIQAYIDVAPSVTPQPKTGHWSRKTKVDAYDIAGVKTWGIKCQCDRCDFTTTVVEGFGYYKYCPNCGCRMVESEEE